MAGNYDQAKLEELADVHNGHSPISQDLAQEVLDLRAQISRLQGDAPAAVIVGEKERASARRCKNDDAGSWGWRCALILGALERAEYELAGYKRVLQDRRLEEGIAAQMRQQCAEAIRYFLDSQGGPLRERLVDLVLAVPIDGWLAQPVPTDPSKL